MLRKGTDVSTKGANARRIVQGGRRSRRDDRPAPIYHVSTYAETQPNMPEYQGPDAITLSHSIGCQCLWLPGWLVVPIQPSLVIPGPRFREAFEDPSIASLTSVAPYSPICLA
jgi:hypothetical protein